MLPIIFIPASALLLVSIEQERSGEMKTTTAIKALSTIAVAILLIATPLFAAGSASTTMTVGARVVKSFSYQVLSHTPVVSITNEDKARGYKDISEAVVLKIKTNSRLGYNIILENQNPAFKRVDVIGNKGGIIAVQDGGANNKTGNITTLNYRIYLSPGIPAGEYAVDTTVMLFPN